MAVKKYNSTTPGFRHRSVVSYEEVTRKSPEKSLLVSIKNKAGRNNLGRVTVRARGGGNKRRYRKIDFDRTKNVVEGRVASIEYDPNRTAFIALIYYKNGRKRYIIAPKNLKVGDMVSVGEDVEVMTGNALPLKNIPSGTFIYNIEIKKGKGGQIARGAGCQALVMSKDAGMVLVKLPSGEVRNIHEDCYASIGQVSNSDKSNTSLGKAGASRWLRRRPKVRGVAMNPVDHPHGGGEGKTSGGRHPVSFSGVPAKGFRTRKKKHRSNVHIVRRRYDTR